jgi:transcription elongation GreA/GreB family factor
MANELERARGTDFATVRTDLVSIGTKVELTELNSGQDETYSVMGAWDSDPDNHIVSYLTPLAQALLNKAAGTEVEFDMGGNLKRYRINSITPALATSTVANPTPGEGASPSA